MLQAATKAAVHAAAVGIGIHKPQKSKQHLQG